MCNIRFEKRLLAILLPMLLLVITSRSVFSQPPVPPHGSNEDYFFESEVVLDVQLHESTVEVGEYFSVTVTAINTAGDIVETFSEEVAFYILNEDEAFQVFPEKEHEFVSGVMVVDDLSCDIPGKYHLLVVCVDCELEGLSEEFSIVPRPLNLFDFFAAHKVYDGTTDVLEQGFEDDRLPGHELVLSYDAAFTDPFAGTSKEVVFSSFTITGGGDADKYFLNTTEDQYAYADILPKTLTIGGSFLVEDKEYDGSAEAIIIENNLFLEDIIQDDEVFLHPVAEFESPEVGIHLVFITPGSELSGQDSLNYILSLEGAPHTVAEIYEEYVFFQSGSWHDPNNWQGNAVPQAGSRVIVLAGARATALSIKENGRVRIEPEGSVHIDDDLIFADNGRMEVKPLARISVVGQISATFNKREEALFIGSDASGSGSLIHQTQGITAHIERYLSNNPPDWHMIAPPTEGQLIEGGEETDFTEGNLFIWAEALQSWISYEDPLWDEIHENRPDFTPGRGYMVSYDLSEENKPVLCFRGEMQAGVFELNVTNNSNPDNTFRGFNLLGNPYPSAIDWKAADGWSDRKNLQETDSVQGGYNMWIWNPETGQYGAQNTASINDYVHNGISRYIPPMQAFWVRASNDISEETIEVNNNARTHTNHENKKNRPLKSPGAIKLITSTESTAYSDEAIIEFGHDSELGGAQKMFSLIPEAPSIYTSKFDKKFSLNFLNSPEHQDTIFVGFEAGVNSEYTLNVLGAHQWQHEAILLDSFTNERITLDENTHYVFYAETADDPDRFMLLFYGVEANLDANQHHDQASVFLYDNILTVNNPWETTATVRVFTSCGKLAESFIAPANASVQQAFVHRPGIYIINVSNNQITYSERVVVSN